MLNPGEQAGESFFTVSVFDTSRGEVFIGSVNVSFDDVTAGTKTGWHTLHDVDSHAESHFYNLLETKVSRTTSTVCRKSKLSTPTLSLFVAFCLLPWSSCDLTVIWSLVR